MWVSILQQFGLQVDRADIQRWQGQGFSQTRIWRVIDRQGNHYGLRCRQMSQEDQRLWLWQVHMRRLSEHPALLLPLITGSGQWWIRNDQGCWTVEPWATGRNDFHAMERDSAASQQRVKSVMENLAHLHTCWNEHALRNSDGIPSLPQPCVSIQKRLQFLQSFQARSSDPIWQQAAACFDQREHTAVSGPTSETDEDLCDWRNLLDRIRQRYTEQRSMVARRLEEAVSLPLTPNVILGDLWSDHLFFEGQELSQVIDYDAMKHDSVVADLGRCLVSLLGQDPDRHQQALCHYESIRPLSDEERQVFDVLKLSGQVLGPLLWVQWFAQGTVTPQPGMYQRILALLEGRPF